MELPPLASYKPRGDGEPPLASAEDWVEFQCEESGRRLRRETLTMPTAIGPRVRPGGSPQERNTDSIRSTIDPLRTIKQHGHPTSRRRGLGGDPRNHRHLPT